VNRQQPDLASVIEPHFSRALEDFNAAVRPSDRIDRPSRLDFSNVDHNFMIDVALSPEIRDQGAIDHIKVEEEKIKEKLVQIKKDKIIASFPKFEENS